MNPSWMALAGLAALGVAAVTLDLRPQPSPERPFYVAERTPLPAETCAMWRARAQRRAAAWPGSMAAFEGFSTLQGACHPQDQARGRALIEAAIARGAGPILTAEYVMALKAVGLGDAATRDFPLAFAAIVAHARAGRATLPEWDGLADMMRVELAFMLAPKTWDALSARVDQLLSRAPILRNLESDLLKKWLGDMSDIDKPQAYFIRDRAIRDGRILTLDGLGRDFYLNGAASCGHPGAIRKRAELYLAGALVDPNPWAIVGSLAWLERETGSRIESLALVVTKASIQFDAASRASMIAEHESRFEHFCG